MWNVLPKCLQIHIIQLLLTHPGVDTLKQISILACISRSFDELTHAAIRCTATNVLRTGGYHPLASQSRLSNTLIALAPSLDELDLSRELVVTRDMWSILLRAVNACFDLKVLRLDHCQHMPAAALDRLLSVTPKLHTLSLVSCQLAVDTSCSSWLPSLTELKHLDVSWCLNFSPPRGWLGALPNLKSLRVKGCDQLDVVDLRQHLTSVKKLEILDVAFISAIDDSFLCSLPPMHASLRHTILAGPSENLWSCGSWTLRGIEFVRDRAPFIDLKFVYS